MSITKKHHYLPEFYLKGFVNECGNFSIYDYEKGHIKKGEFAPSTHFYEPHRNTIETSSGKTDFMETAYSIKDNAHAKLFHLIQSSTEPVNLDDEKMVTLMHFASTLFWRIPKNDRLYEEEYESNAIFKKVWKLYNKETGEEISGEELERLYNHPPFKKSLQVTAGDFLFMAHNPDDMWNWRLTYSKTSYNLCSDSPLILKNEDAKDIFKTDFILPLTKSHILIRTFKKIEITKAPPEFSLLISICLYKQGIKFCACNNRGWLNQIALISTSFALQTIKAKLFNYLEDADGAHLLND